MLAQLQQYIRMELKILLRQPSEWMQPLLLYTITIALFGLTLSNQTELLQEVGGVVIWVAILFAMLSLAENIFRKDIEEGWLSQLKLSQTPLWIFMLGKAIAFWCVIFLGLMISLPIIILWLSFDLAMLSGMALIFMIATPALMVLLLFGLSLTMGLPRPSLLLGLILVPICIPILILGQSAIHQLRLASWPAFELAILGAISIVMVMFLPILSALALKQTSEE